MPTVDVLLATFNGAKFLPEQLQSLDTQSFDDWRLIVRDDGSTDGSLDLVRDWAARSRRDLVVVEDSDVRIGPAKSFARLLENSNSPYFAFCDQDDVWHPRKIERLLLEMRKLESDFTKASPLLTHCDLCVVKADLSPSGQKFWKQSAIKNVSINSSDADHQARNSLFLQNIVTGCATLGNAELRRRAVPFPDGVYMHDWWLAMIAAHFGGLQGIPDALVDYRQHGSNSVGAHNWGPLHIFRRFISNPVSHARRVRDVIAGLQEQAQRFVDQFGADLATSDARALREFSLLRQHNLITRKTFMMRLSAYPQSRVRGLILLLFI